MDTCRYVSILFLVLLATAQAVGRGQGRPSIRLRKMRKVARGWPREFRRRPWRNYETKPLRTEDCTQESLRSEGEDTSELEDQQERVQEKGDLGELDETGKKLVGDINSSINPDSTLRVVNQELEKIREQFRKDNLGVSLEEINNHALVVLLHSGYSLKHDLLSEMDEAIKQGYYAFLQSLYPTTTMPWWENDDFVGILVKAFSCKEWMSKEKWKEWMSKEEWKVQMEVADLGLRFRDLIRIKNAAVYEDECLRGSIFKNDVFKKNFQEIIKEAYDSGNTAFLKVVPPPSDVFILGEINAVFFWSLAFGQDWCSKEWSNYINTIKNIDNALRLSEIFDHSNPKVFEHKRVKKFLKENRIRETLETAIEFDSLSFAKYLKGKHGEEKFKKMVKACSKIHTRGKKFSPFSQELLNKYDKERLSRVYSFLLDNGRDLGRDAPIIRFYDIPFLDEKHLRPLLDGGFDKVPLSQDDFELYGSTKTGLEFLKIILKREYNPCGIPFMVSLGSLSHITLEMLDIEALKMIERRFGVNCPGILEGLYRRCMRTAIEKEDIKFLTDVLFPTLGPTFDSILLSGEFLSPAGVAFNEATKGRLAVLDWIFDYKPTLLGGLEWHAHHRCLTPVYVPFLRYIFKRSKEKMLPPYAYLAKYAESHLSEAIYRRDFDHYRRVCDIEGVMEAMNKHGLTIPEFPGRG